MSESVNISGDFNGNLYMNGFQPEEASESFFADVVWEGKMYRLEVEGKILSKNELAEQIQGEYPGAIVQRIYPIEPKPEVRIADVKRYHPGKLEWV